MLPHHHLLTPWVARYQRRSAWPTFSLAVAHPALSVVALPCSSWNATLTADSKRSYLRCVQYKQFGKLVTAYYILLSALCVGRKECQKLGMPLLALGGIVLQLLERDAHRRLKAIAPALCVNLTEYRKLITTVVCLHKRAYCVA
jgi:hypothetical protein